MLATFTSLHTSELGVQISVAWGMYFLLHQSSVYVSCENQLKLKSSTLLAGILNGMNNISKNCTSKHIIVSLRYIDTQAMLSKQFKKEG